MKKQFTLLALLALSVTGLAQQQVSNAGLENWTTVMGVQKPDSFHTNNDFIVDAVTTSPDADAHSGNYSALLETKHSTLVGGPVMGRLVYAYQGGFSFKSWPFMGRPSKLHFWYKYQKAGNDTSFATIVVKKYHSGMISDPVGFAKWETNTNTSTWTHAEVTLSYLNSDIPDTMDLFFQNAVFSYTLGTKLWIDDIMLEYTTGIEEPAQGVMVKFFPNPANGSFTTELPGGGQFDLSVMDISGKLMYRNSGQKSKSAIDCSQWPAGLYIVQVKTATASYTERLMLSK
jgi:hypothetical protein